LSQGITEPTDRWDALNAHIIACRRCPRLVAWREQVARTKRRAFAEWEYWGKPVPGFGDRRARLVILGLAPAAHGANRTGRMFTGDGSADTLIAALHRAGFANRPISRHRDDGLELREAFLTAAVRCAPPGNKPTREEMSNCSSYLEAEFGLLDSAAVVLALGRIAFDRYLQWARSRGAPVARPAFHHGARVEVGAGLPVLYASYHPSRQNTQTGRLTPRMLDSVLEAIRRELSA
jgi:uracil-DNA glycosylase family 4